MNQTLTLNGRLFAEMVRGGAFELMRNRVIVNELNVFPIPDGDTGDNMYMTVDAGAVAGKAESSDRLDDISQKIARGMLLGARGNSGVILSRIFAGIAKGFAEVETAGIETFAAAMKAGIDESYRAVSNPVEGTILTVYREGVTKANGALRQGQSLEEYFDVFSEELRASLERTPDLLDTLKKAGVVDSGGAGLSYIVEGMKKALSGTVPEEAKEQAAPAAEADYSLFDENSTLEYGYCTEFLLRLQSSKVDLSTFDEAVIFNYLNSVGESVVAFREGTIVKVHVHTMHPGEILNTCQQWGEFLKLKIENMTLQHQETTVQKGASSLRRSVHKAYATVAVASGEGLVDIFRSLGVDAVVEGGQSMNPSAESFIKAFDTLDADTILVFPNNGNVILTAKQAAALYVKAKVVVLPSKNVGEGYAALSMMDISSGDTDAIVSSLTEIMDGVVTGMVSRANRDTEMNGISIKTGDAIGFSGDDVLSDAPDSESVTLELAQKLHAERYDVLLLLCGKDAHASRAKELYETLVGTYRRTEVIMLDGKQPIYDYILILE